jgi:hypothetical protein
MLWLLMLLTKTAEAQTQYFNYTTINGSITITAFTGPTPTALTIPSTINGLPVTGIGNDVFQFSPLLTSVTLPETLTSIGDWAFTQSGLTNITLPNGLTNLGIACFGGCSNLQSATLSASLTSLSGVFGNCTKLASIAIPNSVTNIAGEFQGCSSLTNVTFGNGLVWEPSSSAQTSAVYISTGTHQCLAAPGRGLMGISFLAVPLLSITYLEQPDGARRWLIIPPSFGTH